MILLESQINPQNKAPALTGAYVYLGVDTRAGTDSLNRAPGEEEQTTQGNRQ